MAKEYVFDPCLQHPFTCMVAGPTQSGKTHFVLKLIEERNASIYPPPEKIIWCYGVYQKAFATADKAIEFEEGLPSNDLLDPDKRTLLIIDDLMCETDQRVTNLFTKGSHHRNTSIIYIVQNVFHKSKHSRDISLNTQYMVLFKNPRDVAQMSHLGRQIFPNKSKYFNEVFIDATSAPHGYLFVDLKQSTPDELRLRNDMFSEKGQTVYMYK